jgi:hypothetical protein
MGRAWHPRWLEQRKPQVRRTIAHATGAAAEAHASGRPSKR